MQNTQHYSAYIDGEALSGKGEEFSSIDPGRGACVWQGKACDHDQVESAIDAARQAFYSWSDFDLAKRQQYCENFVDLLDKQQEAFANLIALETGKPLWESRTEVAAMKGKLAISLQAYHERTGTKSGEAAGARAVLRHKPHGVVAVFGPYNFPGHLPNGHIIPALLAGNTVVFKPSELTPKTGQAMLELWLQAGLPKGVINLVQGGRDTGIALANASGIDGIFFTGSAATGEAIKKSVLTHSHKILALELGGNNPLIIGNITDVKAAVFETIQSAYITAGQRCTCARRLIVKNGEQGDAFLQQLTASIQGISVNYYDADPQPYMGAVISADVAKAILTKQDALLESGARALVACEALESSKAMLSPGLIDISGASHVPDEEIFGPVLQVLRYDNFDQAIVHANNTHYGLSAGLFSESKDEFEIFFKRIRAGIVNWNKQLTGASSAAPFGGVGASGNYRPSAYYAADYCAYPVASLQKESLSLPDAYPAGLDLD